VPRHRVGVALLVPPPVATEIDGLRRALGDGTRGRIPAHVTLVPPVNVTASALDDALAVLRAAAASRVGPLRLRLGPATTFHPVTPVVYLAVDGDVDALVALREAVFRPPLARRLTHPFVPHATIADEMQPARIPAAVAALADYRAEVTIDRLTLLAESPGRIWRPVADTPFGPPAVVARGGLPLELTVSHLVDPVAARLLRHPPTAAPDPGPGRPAPEPAAGEGPDTARGDPASPGPDPGPGPWAVTARRDGRVVGVAHGVTIGDRLEVGALVVDPEHRGQGVGRHLRAAVVHLAGVRSVAWPPT
jgi:2'-5' RNA ligase